jgi:hypothetical protein
MYRLFSLAGVAALVAFYSLAASAADTGKITYAKGNCFVIQTAKGATLFERSGGKSPAVDDTVSGVLNDFGYQQLHDASGKELMVGFVQYFGVKKDPTIESFKKSCR